MAKRICATPETAPVAISSVTNGHLGIENDQTVAGVRTRSLGMPGGTALQ